MSRAYVEVELTDFIRAIEKYNKRTNKYRLWMEVSEKMSIPAHEYVYQHYLSNKPDCGIRVYSSIVKCCDKGRDVGKDAIRVVGMNFKKKVPLTKAIVVQRIGTWDKNLDKAINRTIRAIQARIARGDV